MEPDSTPACPSESAGLGWGPSPGSLSLLQLPLASLDGQGSTNPCRSGTSPEDPVLGESHPGGVSDRPLPIPHPYAYQPLQGSPDRTAILSPFIYRQTGDPVQVHEGSGCPSTAEKLEV